VYFHRIAGVGALNLVRFFNVDSCTDTRISTAENGWGLTGIRFFVAKLRNARRRKPQTFSDTVRSQFEFVSKKSELF